MPDAAQPDRIGIVASAGTDSRDVVCAVSEIAPLLPGTLQPPRGCRPSQLAHHGRGEASEDLWELGVHGAAAGRKCRRVGCAGARPDPSVVLGETGQLFRISVVLHAAMRGGPARPDRSRVVAATRGGGCAAGNPARYGHRMSHCCCVDEPLTSDHSDRRRPWRVARPRSRQSCWRSLAGVSLARAEP